MSLNSSIEWTDATWNPVTGCSEISPGCDHCYAKTFAERWRGVPNHPYEQGFDVRLWENRLDYPIRWKKPRRIFVNSMSDLFHPRVPDHFIAECFRTMILANHHVFQILTKRPARMKRLMPHIWSLCGVQQPPAHIWLGVSVESNVYRARVDHLRQTPAAVRFISAEPLLGLLDRVDLDCIDLVIAGGESGPKARPMHPEWARDIRDRCMKHKCTFFFKQHGSWIAKTQIADFGIMQPDIPIYSWHIRPDWQCTIENAEWGCLDIHGHYRSQTTTWNSRQEAEQDDYEVIVYRVGKKAAGRLLDGIEYTTLV